LSKEVEELRDMVLAIFDLNNISQNWKILLKRKIDFFNIWYMISLSRMGL
jgi:hypothetical protein